MGNLAFIYRMMKVREYNVAEVDDMFIWQVAVVLDVDLKMDPMNKGQDAQPARSVEVTQDLMSTPTGVMELSPEALSALLGEGLVGRESPAYG